MVDVHCLLKRLGEKWADRSKCEQDSGSEAVKIRPHILGRGSEQLRAYSEQCFELKER